MVRWRLQLACALAVLSAVVLCCGAATAGEAGGGRPLLIAHRGSPCELPEETLEGYRAALEHGIDFIELDAVSTKDGHLICRHGPTLDDSTDVLQHPKFAARRRSQVMPDGRNVTGCFTSDFTLAEVRQLRATQAFPFRDHSHDGKFRIPTLAEVLHLVGERAAAGERGGAYLETKEPSFHDARGLPLEAAVVAELTAAGFRGDSLAQRVVLQSFEEQSLRKLHVELQRIGADSPATAPPLSWLFDCGGVPNDAQLDAFAVYGQGIAPEKGLLEDLQPSMACGIPPAGHCDPGGVHCTGSMAEPPNDIQGDRASSSLFQRAEARGLYVHPWTVRQETHFLPEELHSAAAELDYLAGPQGIGVQGVILDCPAVGAAWLRSQGWEEDAPMLQAAAGSIGAAAGQAEGSGNTSSGGAVFGMPPWEAAAAAGAVACMVAGAVAAAIWLWRRQRHRAKRYDVFPDIVPQADYANYGREQLSGMHVPPSPMLRTGDLQLTALPPESPFRMAHYNEHDSLVLGSRA